MRAKSALGGKVPSPPLTPSTPADSSDAGVPKALDAPSYPYLKYSLPPLRPVPNGNKHQMHSDTSFAPKIEDANKENDANWNTGGTAANNNNDWSNTGPANDNSWNAGTGGGN